MISTAATIWEYLKQHGYNDFACAGILGNLYAESGLIPTNLQNSYEKRLGYNDATYTAAVDSGKYTNFANDAAGYGLAQWTAASRKAGLLSLKKKTGLSIGSLALQLEFLCQELKSYPALKTAASVRAASDIMLLKFERPYDQSTANQIRRAGFSQGFYNQFAGKGGGGADPVPEYAAGLLPAGVNYITLDVMRIRSGPGTGYPQKKFSEMTAAAQKSNAAYKNTGLAFYAAGITYTATETATAADGSQWAKTPSGWVCMAGGPAYCKKAN